MIERVLKSIYRKLFNKKPVDKSVLRIMQNNPRYDKYKVGKGTYGFPTIYDWGDDSKLEIGNYCSIGDNVSILLGGEHRSDFISTYPFQSFSTDKSLLQDRKTKGNVVLGNDVWIGNNVLLLSGVKIGNGAIIGAGSVVTKDVEDFSIVAGNPAKQIRKRFSDVQIEKLSKICWWNWNEDKINSNLEDIISPNIDRFIDKHYEV